jgi:hypothetical protein
MYKYLEEMHQRDVARTIAEKAESRKKEIPFIIAKYFGIAAIILAIGAALYFANSFKQISQSIHTSQAQLEDKQNQYVNNEDEIINIDALLEDNQSKQKFPSQNIEPFKDQKSVRNYVIFDRIDFDFEGIKKITIGRQYDDPESDINSSWCYVDKVNLEGLKNTLYLISIHEERKELEITNELAESFGVSKSTLVEAQKLCNI